MAMQCSQRNYDIKSMMVRELAFQRASLFHGCGAKTKTKTKLFSRVIWKSNLHRYMHKLMHHSWMDVMYCGSWHGPRLELFWTSSATSDTWNHRFWFIHVPVDSFLANCDQRHIFLLAWVSQPCFHEIFSFRWKTWSFDAAQMLHGTFRDIIFWPASVSDEYSWWP